MYVQFFFVYFLFFGGGEAVVGRNTKCYDPCPRYSKVKENRYSENAQLIISENLVCLNVPLIWAPLTHKAPLYFLEAVFFINKKI